MALENLAYLRKSDICSTTINIAPALKESVEAEMQDLS